LTETGGSLSEDLCWYAAIGLAYTTGVWAWTGCGWIGARLW